VPEGPPSTDAAAAAAAEDQDDVPLPLPLREPGDYPSGGIFYNAALGVFAGDHSFFSAFHNSQDVQKARSKEYSL